MWKGRNRLFRRVYQSHEAVQLKRCSCVLHCSLVLSRSLYTDIVLFLFLFFLENIGVRESERRVRKRKINNVYRHLVFSSSSTPTPGRVISCSYRRNLRAPRFRLKWRILICFSSQKKSKQILAYEIEKNDLRKELYLLKNKAYNLRNFSTFAAILKILNPQCIAIVVRTPPAPTALPLGTGGQ